MMMKLSIIVPVYNELPTIGNVINKIKSAALPELCEREILVVDDGSTDGTTDFLKIYEKNPGGIQLIRLSVNKGKTNALRQGISVATGNLILFQDADLEYDPHHYARLIGPLLQGKADVVFGSRFKGTIQKMTPLIKAANMFTNLTVNFLFGTNLTDVNTCYKVMRSDVLKNIRITLDGFAGDSELTCRLLQKRLRILEVPIDYCARSKEEGKKLNWLAAMSMYAAYLFYPFKNEN